MRLIAKPDLRLALGVVLVAVHMGGAVALPSFAADATEAESLTLDEQFDRIAQEVPTFAGLWLDGDGLVVSVVSGALADGEAVQQVAAAVLEDRDFATAELRVEGAEFSWVQLRAWYRPLVHAVWEPANVAIADIDELANRITIIVADQDRDEPTVRSLASDVGVPPEALHVSQGSVPIPDSLMDGREAVSRSVAGITTGVALLSLVVVTALVMNKRRARERPIHR